MDIIVSARHMDVSPAMKSQAVKRLEKLEAEIKKK